MYEFHDFLAFRRTNNEILPVFRFDEETLAGVRDKHPHFAQGFMAEMAKAAVHSAAPEGADGFVEETAAVFNDAARFDVLDWDFHFPDRSPNSEAFFIDNQAQRNEKGGPNQHS